MSVVTGLVLMCSLGWEELQASEHPPGAIELINRWLQTRNLPPLIDIADNAVGNKHPQAMIFTAGFNNFPEDEFAAFFQSLDWGSSDRAILLLQPEQGSTRVFRPPHTMEPPRDG